MLCSGQMGTLNDRNVPARIVSFAILLGGVLLNYLIPNVVAVLALVTSMATICFIWGLRRVLVAHLCYPRTETGQRTKKCIQNTPFSAEELSRSAADFRRCSSGLLLQHAHRTDRYAVLVYCTGFLPIT